MVIKRMSKEMREKFDAEFPIDHLRDHPDPNIQYLFRRMDDLKEQELKEEEMSEIFEEHE
jgi:hypothetical protein